MRKRVATLAAIAALASLILPMTAQAATATIRIRQSVLRPDGNVQIIVALGGDTGDKTLKASDFSVSEAGRAIQGLTVKPLGGSDADVTLSLAFDVSGSMAGQPLVDAKNAALRFLSLLPPNVRVSLVAFGGSARLLVPSTRNRDVITRSIRNLTATGDTTLYDAVKLAAQTELRNLGAQHNIVVFSDGRDTQSRTTLAQAIAAARQAKAQILAVGLVTPDFDAQALFLLASRTGGRTLPVGRSTELTSAFGEVARTIASQYVINYRATTTTPKELDLVVSAKVGASTISDRVAVLNPRTAEAVAPKNVREPADPTKPLIPGLSGDAALYGGLLVAFIAALLFLGVLLTGPQRNRARRVLNRAAKYSALVKRRQAELAGEEVEEERSGPFGAIGRHAGDLIERVPVRGYDERVQLLLDRAAWPLRASEFMALQLVGFAAGLLVGWGLLGRWWLGVVLAVFGLLAPRIAVQQRIDKRAALFLEQLPNTLDLLAGSLQAGYGFMQALDTLVQESQPPTQTEFRRVLTETRLGMPVEDALVAMADRVDQEDFRWVVLAINIQRQVGGNLAELLRTVSYTLRERAQVRRQIRVLSAEGRLSAVILVVLPFLLAGYITFVNPEYIGQLFSRLVGQIMVAGAVVLMGLGILWLRKLVRIDV